MKLSDRIRMGIYLSDDEGAGGGAATADPVEIDDPTIADAAEDPEEIEQPAGEEPAPADEEEEPAEGDEPAADPAEQPADDQEAAFQKWAEERGYTKPAEEPGGEPAAAAVDDLTWSESPREQAFREAEAEARSADWAEDRALEILQERSELNALRNSRPAQVSHFEAIFERDGIPKAAAGSYVDSLLRIGFKGGGAAAMNDPQVQRVALEHAIGAHFLAEVKAGRNPFAGSVAAPEAPAKKQPVTPTNGAGDGAVSLGKLGADDQKYIAQWSKVHNGGKPPTAKQLAQMRDAGEID